MRCLVVAISLTSLLAAAVLLTLAVRPARPLPPGLHLTPPTHDFGDVRPGDQLVTRLTVRNAHPTTVTVDNVGGGCNCFKAEVEPRVIPAGGRAELVIDWSVASKRGPSSESILLTYSGGGGPGFAVARVTANVLRPVAPEPEVVDVPADGQAVVRFHSPTGRSFRLLAVAVSHPCLRAVLAPDGRSVAVSLDPSVLSWESGLLQLTVTTDLPDEREVPVRVQVRKV